VVVSGDSAGGNIACSAAHQHRRHISAALLFYPILNLATFDTESWLALGHPDKHLLLNRPMALAQVSQTFLILCFCLFAFVCCCQMPNLFHDYEHALLASASPVFETDWEDVPPVHVLAAGFDPLLDDSKQYVQK
jgi:acetyl esterase/lipase